MNEKQKIETFLTRGVTNIIEEKDLREKLFSAKKLRIKLGIDPTGSNIHLGRAVVLWKLRSLQDLGHTIVLIIGDFTAQIGDPSDKTEERKGLNNLEIKKNLKDYLNQIGTIIDISKCEVLYNSEWLSKLDFNQISELTDAFSVSEMLDRDNFSKRYKANQRISLREFMYPLMQGYDSVIVKSDLEIGGNDQYFNLMAGRKIQKIYNQSAQNIITFEFLVGLDGRKMSTSWGNGIFINDAPQDMFGKIMTLKDDLILDYFRLATDIEQSSIDIYKEDLKSGRNPKEIKEILAYTIVKRYYGEEIADQTKLDFERIFSEKKISKEDFIEYIYTKDDYRLVNIIAEIFKLSLTQSKDLIKSGAIKFVSWERDNDLLTIMDIKADILDPQITDFVQSTKNFYIKKGKKDKIALILN